MSESRDYWLSLAVYDEFRGVPVRKVIARGYLDLRAMERDKQAALIRLGSLFFQGRSWRKYVGDMATGVAEHLSAEERGELEGFLGFKRELGAAVARLLDDDPAIAPAARDAALERLESMGFV